MNSDTKHTHAALIAAPKPGDARPFTVFGANSRTGQLLVEHVFAEDGLNAFTAVAQKYEAADSPDIDLVVALPGHLDEGADQFILPGDSLVDGATVLEQPDVFGAPPPGPAAPAPPRSHQ